MSLFKKKPEPPKNQHPWLITIHSEVKNKGCQDEFDPGFIEFEHKQTRLSIKEELDWIYGRGAFKPNGTPSLINVWDMLLKYTPGMRLIVHKNWHIEREQKCFVSQLADRGKGKYVLKRVTSNVTCIEQDFASFLKMLDNEQEYHDSNSVNTILSLDDEREKRSKPVTEDNYADYNQ